MSKSIFKRIDKKLFGPPGKVSGLIGDVVNDVIDNPNSGTRTILNVATTGMVSYLASPWIAYQLGGTGLLGASGTGTLIDTLDGAARTSASLKKLGFGHSMKAGKAVIGITGGATSGMLSNEVGKLDNKKDKLLMKSKKLLRKLNKLKQRNPNLDLTPFKDDLIKIVNFVNSME